MDELIEKIKHNIKYHMRPYNLGDNGETEMLIMKLINRYEALQKSVKADKCPDCGGSGFMVKIDNRKVRCSYCNGTGICL